MGECDEILIWYPGSSLHRALEQDRIYSSAVKRQTGLRPFVTRNHLP